MKEKNINWKSYDDKYIRKTIKFTPGEYAIIHKKAKDQQRTDEPAIATYIKLAALNKHVLPQESVPEINKEMFLELKRVGVNVNQLAKNVNVDMLQNKNIFLISISNQINILALKIDAMQKNIVPYDNKR